MKSVSSSKQTNNPNLTKRITPDYSDMERNNIYAETPPKTKTTNSTSSSSIAPPTLVNGTSHYMPILPQQQQQQQQQRRPPSNNNRDGNLRHSAGASTSSVSSFSTTTSSSQSTTPSNSFRQDSTSIMTRSADASSICGLISQTKNVTNQLKSKSTYDIDASTADRPGRPTQTKEQHFNNNSKGLNPICNGNFVPLQSVKEDECLEVLGCHSQEKSNKVRHREDEFLSFDKYETLTLQQHII